MLCLMLAWAGQASAQVRLFLTPNSSQCIDYNLSLPLNRAREFYLGNTIGFYLSDEEYAPLTRELGLGLRQQAEGDLVDILKHGWQKNDYLKEDLYYFFNGGDELSVNTHLHFYLGLRSFHDARDLLRLYGLSLKKSGCTNILLIRTMAGGHPQGSVSIEDDAIFFHLYGLAKCPEPLILKMEELRNVIRP